MKNREKGTAFHNWLLNELTKCSTLPVADLSEVDPKAVLWDTYFKQWQKEERDNRRRAREQQAEERRVREEQEERERFLKETANWNERLLNAVLEFMNDEHQELSVVVRGDKVVFTKNEQFNRYTNEFEVKRVPEVRWDLRALEEVEVEVQDAQQRRAEEERRCKLRASALSKLSDEERTALGV